MKLTKENILEKVDERTIFQHYFPHKIDLRKNKYKNPFRIDRHEGSCHFNYYKGKFYFFDKANNECIDIFKYLQKLYGLTFTESLCKINLDFNLKLNAPKEISEKLKQTNLIENFSNDGLLVEDDSSSGKVEFKIKVKSFSKSDLRYWADYCITSETLNLYNVKVAKEYSVTNDGLTYRKRYKYDKNDPCYVYQVKRFNNVYVKLYRPLSTVKANKWRSNCIDSIIYGYDQLTYTNDILIITKSLKDVMCLYELGYEAISPISENIILTPYTMIEFLKKYKKVYVMFDNDRTGRKYSKIYTNEFKIKSIEIPDLSITNDNLESAKCKDISDVIKRFGKDYAKTLMNNLINNANNKQIVTDGKKPIYL